MADGSIQDDHSLINIPFALVHGLVKATILRIDW